MSQNITLIATITVHEEFRAKAEEILKFLARHSNKEEGCMQYDLHANIQNKNVFVIFEKWENQEFLDKHRVAPHFLEYKEKTKEIVKNVEITALNKIEV